VLRAHDDAPPGHSAQEGTGDGGDSRRVQVDHIRLDSSHEAGEAGRPAGVGQPSPASEHMGRHTCVEELAHEVVLVREHVGDLYIDVDLPDVRERHEQALGTTGSHPLDDVEDPHRLTLPRLGHRYGATSVPDIEIREYCDADEGQVLGLLAASLGKSVDDRYRGFFRWKHLQNPFGRSFMWVGESDGRVLGFRSFLRWRFLGPGGEPVEAVRAVDTATHPDAQGKGIFRSLTMHGLGEMRPAGIAFVFNTPNDQSRPGYLKMGWRIDGRVPVQVRPRSLPSLLRVVRARTAADPWSLPATVGLELESLVDRLDVAAVPQAGQLVTDRSPDFVRWRYSGCSAVASRAIPVGEEGALLIRLRRRGDAVECTVGDALGSPSSGAAGAALRRVLANTGADFALASARTPVRGMVRSSRLGPVQTRRSVSSNASDQPLSLALGDVELF
jgi:GNAT superfamily N-acetyltransferase